MTYDTYISYAISASISKLVYMNPASVDELWSKSKSQDMSGSIIHRIFNGVDKCPIFHTNDDSDAQAYSWIQGKTLFIGFRGTQNTEDLLIDLDIMQTHLIKSSNILVHNGFRKQFISLELQISKQINENINFIDTLHFTGHSLGGALATLSAAYYGSICKGTGVKIVCHTIGSPRVGNKAFSKWFSENVDDSIRIRNMKDPVSLIPLSFLYTHVENSICINDDCLVITVKKDIPWYWRLLYFPFEISYRSPVHCHTCDLYIERLLKLANVTLDFKF